MCVACLLFLLGHDGLSLSRPDTTAVAALRRELSERITCCGIALEAIVSTSRVREELRECARLLLPSAGDESDESESDEDGDDDERATLVNLTTRAWDVEAFAYFVTESGQEYAFASWSADGIRALVYELLVASQAEEHGAPLSLAIAPHAWLFLLAPSIQRFLQSEGAGPDRHCGIVLLVQTLARVPDAAVPYHCAPELLTASSRTERPSFAAVCAGMTALCLLCVLRGARERLTLSPRSVCTARLARATCAARDERHGRESSARGPRAGARCAPTALCQSPHRRQVRLPTCLLCHEHERVSY